MNAGKKDKVPVAEDLTNAEWQTGEMPKERMRLNATRKVGTDWKCKNILMKFARDQHGGWREWAWKKTAGERQALRCKGAAVAGIRRSTSPEVGGLLLDGL